MNSVMQPLAIQLCLHAFPEAGCIIHASVRRPFRGRKGYETDPSLILYETDSETVFDAIVPEYLAGMVYGAMCEFCCQ